MWLMETSDRFGTYVPCGKCYACRSNRRNVWTFRMERETEVSESAYYLTLTYDSENVPLVDQWNTTVMSLWKPDLQMFFKRLRENVSRWSYYDERWFKKSKSGVPVPKIRYFACGEYGKFGDRPHYHVILWNMPNYFVDVDPIHKKTYSDLIERTWDKGIVDVEANITRGAMHYVAKYTLDPLVSEWQNYDYREKPYAVMSRNPGIGKGWINDEIKNYYYNNKNSYSIREDNYKLPIGRYLFEKVYQDNIEANREAKYKAKRYIDKEQEREEARITKGLSEGEALKRINDVRRERYKDSFRKVQLIMKNNKL